MTIADRIREEESQLTFERTTFDNAKGLWEAGQKADYIANVFKLPLQKIEEIIQKLRLRIIEFDKYTLYF